MVKSVETRADGSGSDIDWPEKKVADVKNADDFPVFYMLTKRHEEHALTARRTSVLAVLSVLFLGTALQHWLLRRGLIGCF